MTASFPMTKTSPPRRIEHLPELPSSIKISETIRPVQVVTIDEYPYCVDISSGEILNPPPTPEPEKIPIRDLRKLGYIGKETAWPSLARDADELLKATEMFDCWQDQLRVSCRKLIQLLSRAVSSNAITVMLYLADNLSGRNSWFGTVADISQDLGIPLRSTERALAELKDRHLIEQKHQGKHWPLRISLHPWYAWKGDASYREHYLKDWAFRTAKSGGEIQLQPSKYGASI